jgi:hypothetical protein
VGFFKSNLKLMFRASASLSKPGRKRERKPEPHHKPGRRPERKERRGGSTAWAGRFSAGRSWGGKERSKPERRRPVRKPERRKRVRKPERRKRVRRPERRKPVHKPERRPERKECRASAGRSSAGRVSAGKERKAHNSEPERHKPVHTPERRKRAHKPAEPWQRWRAARPQP